MANIVPLSVLPDSVNPIRVNPIEIMFEACVKDDNTMTELQITDSTMTQNSVALETAVYDYWNVTPYLPENGDSPYGDNDQYLPEGGAGRLGNDAWWVQNEAGNSNGGQAAAQAQYQTDSATAQGQESQADGTVQSIQNQSGTDGTNLQQKAQLMQTITSVLSTLVGLLGHLLGS